MHFDNPGIVDCDGKLANAVAYHRRRDPEFKFKYATITTDDSGAHVPIAERWPRLCRETAALVADPWVKTVIIDSGSNAADYLQDWIANDVSKRSEEIREVKVLSQRDWYSFKQHLQRYVLAGCSCGKRFVMTVHIRTDKDEVLGTIIYRPTIPGQTGENFGKLWTNYWLCQCVAVPTDTAHPRGVKYTVRTASTARLQLGCSNPAVPAEWEVTKENLKYLA